MYPENPEGTQVIVGSMNMGYISDTARNQTHNLFRPKWEPIPLDHSDGQSYLQQYQPFNNTFSKSFFYKLFWRFIYNISVKNSQNFYEIILHVVPK